jgi:hypothetical protein
VWNGGPRSVVKSSNSDLDSPLFRVGRRLGSARVDQRERAVVPRCLDRKGGGPIFRHRPTERSPAARAHIMWMAPSGQAEMQCSSLVQVSARTRAPEPSRRSKQPEGQIEPHRPHAWQRSRRTEGTHFWNIFTLIPRTAEPMIAGRQSPPSKRYKVSRTGTRRASARLSRRFWLG